MREPDRQGSAAPCETRTMSTVAADRPSIVYRSAYDQGFARVAAVTLPVPAAA